MKPCFASFQVERFPVNCTQTNMHCPACPKHRRKYSGCSSLGASGVVTSVFWGQVFQVIWCIIHSTLNIS